MKKIYDYSFLKNMQVPAKFLSITNSIYALRAIEEEKKQTYPDIFTNLQKIAIVQSVKGSNAIEGIVTSDKRIEEIVNQNSDPLNHSEKEIAGYKDALNIVHTNYESLSLNVETMKYLHGLMLEHTELSHRGDFKKEDNVIREKYPDGTSRIRFEPVSAKETEEAMKELVYAYIEARDDSEVNQLLLIPCVILDFLCIHPFQDGNGRMSRLLSLLLMYKNNFDVSKYISFEEQINKLKGNYYEALKQSSVGWHDNKNDYIPFMENFLSTLYLCYKELDKRFLTLRSGKVSKAKRVEEVVLSAFIPLSKKEIENLLPDVSVTTIERVLSTMIKDSKIDKIGTTNNCRYIRKK
ncbi:MAG: Fic family protein [Bacilli bacterium]|nr:Fic family protein [Bacilli bacterium]